MMMDILSVRYVEMPFILPGYFKHMEELILNRNPINVSSVGKV
jgi:hypothetical protein